MMFHNDPSVSEYTKGYMTADVDLVQWGIEEVAEIASYIHDEGYSEQWVIGYRTRLGVAQERLAR